MGKTKTHCCKVLGIKTVKKGCQLATNAAEEIEGVGIAQHVNAQLFIDWSCYI